MSNISIHTMGTIATLTFNRPEHLNAMNRVMMDEIIEGIQSINTNQNISVGVLTGAGRAFMAGADIKEYGSQTAEEFDAFQLRGRALYESLETDPIPWIAAVNGFALGGGFEIAMACDFILASSEAKMGLPEVFLNLVPGGGGTQRLVQKIGINRVKEMLYLGGQYSAEQMCNWGIVNHIYDPEVFVDEVNKFAGKLSRRPKQSVSMLKKLAQLSLQPQSFKSKLEKEGKAVSELFHSPVAKKKIQDFIDKSS